MNLLRNIFLVVLLVIMVAFISYQLLDSPVENKEQENLDQQLKNKVETKNELSNLITDKQQELKEQENLFQFLKKPLLGIDNFNAEQEFKLNYQQLQLQTAQDKEKQSTEQKQKDKLQAETIEEGDIFLGIKDGCVAIYKGNILGEKKVLEVKKDIPLKNLSQEDIKRLQLGIKIKNKKELLSILEGFSSAEN